LERLGNARAPRIFPATGAALRVGRSRVRVRDWAGCTTPWRRWSRLPPSSACARCRLPSRPSC